MDGVNRAPVVFDAAGTLVELRGRVGELYAELLPPGLPVTADGLTTGFARAFGDAPSLAFGRADPVAERGWWRDVVLDALRSAGVAAETFDFPRFFDHAFEAFATQRAWRLLPDARPALRALRVAGHPLAVLSNWDVRLASLLSDLGVAGYFCEIFVSSRLPAAKPSGAAFEAVAAALEGRFGTVRPWMVGDRIENDIASAVAAGWSAVWVDRGARGSAVPEGAHRVSDLAALPGIVS